MRGLAPRGTLLVSLAAALVIAGGLAFALPRGGGTAAAPSAPATAPPSPAVPTEPPPTDSCTNCHRNLAGRLASPAEGMADDAHAKRGLRCASCHGGNAAAPGMEAHDKARGFLGAPTLAQVPQFCGRCHANPDLIRRFNPRLPTDQLARYQTSVHGRRLREGDRNVAVCTSCHGVHPVRAVSDSNSPVFHGNVPATCARCHADASRMKAYEIPTTQYAQYRESVHGQALLVRGSRQAPACNDCHGNHGAVPPGVSSVANVCAQCHSATRDLFARSRHKDAFPALGLPQCIACHGTHAIRFPTDQMLGTAQGSICLQCHPQGSAGYTAAGEIRATLEAIQAAMARSDAALGRAARAGMDVSEAQLEMDQARTALIRARAVTHTTSAAEVRKTAAPGMEAAARALAVGQKALAELAFRRRGFAVSAVVIGFVVVILWLRLRTLERR